MLGVGAAQELALGRMFATLDLNADGAVDCATPSHPPLPCCAHGCWLAGGCADSEFRQTTGAKEPVKVPELEKELAEVLVEEAK